jgi:hypothetical protein
VLASVNDRLDDVLDVVRGGGVERDGAVQGGAVAAAGVGEGDGRRALLVVERQERVDLAGLEQWYSSGSS